MTDTELELVTQIVARLREGAPLGDLVVGADPAVVQTAVEVAGELSAGGMLIGQATPAGFAVVWEAVAMLGGVGASGAAAAAVAGASGAGGAGATGAGGAGATGAGATGAGAAGAGGAGVTAAGGAGVTAAGGAGVTAAGGAGASGAVMSVFGASWGPLAAVVGVGIATAAVGAAVLLGTSGDDAPPPAAPGVAQGPDAEVGDDDVALGGPDDGSTFGDGGEADEDPTSDPTLPEGADRDPPTTSPPDAGRTPTGPQVGPDRVIPRAPIDRTDPVDPGDQVEPVPPVAPPVPPVDPVDPVDPGAPPVDPGQPPVDPGEPPVDEAEPRRTVIWDVLPTAPPTYSFVLGPEAVLDSVVFETSLQTPVLDRTTRTVTWQVPPGRVPADGRAVLVVTGIDTDGTPWELTVILTRP